MKKFDQRKDSITEWETPQELFDELNSEFNFDLDVCALSANAKCEEYITPEVDGLGVSWKGRRCWMNPPYGREITKWIEKAATSNAKIVVALIPARTDTRWFHNFIYKKAEVRFIKGRVQFIGEGKRQNAPFPSMVVIFD